MFLKFPTQPFSLSLPLCFNNGKRLWLPWCMLPIIHTTDSTAPALAECQRIRGASQALCSSSKRRCDTFLTFLKVIPPVANWQQPECLFSGASVSEPALSCAQRTGRQTSALTIIELIVFFLCYCPLFQKSRANQTIAHTWKPRLVRACLTNIRTTLFWRYFWTKAFRPLQRLLLKGLHLLTAMKHHNLARLVRTDTIK